MFLANSLLLSAVTGCTQNNKSGTLTNLIYLIYSGTNACNNTSVIITNAQMMKQHNHFSCSSLFDWMLIIASKVGKPKMRNNSVHSGRVEVVKNIKQMTYVMAMQIIILMMSIIFNFRIPNSKFYKYYAPLMIGLQHNISNTSLNKT